MLSEYIHPLTIGSIHLKNNILVAPLAGVSDYPFRCMASSFGPGMICTEMVKMDGLVRLERASFRLLDYDPSMHPIAAQLCGTNPSFAATAAQMIEDMGFDSVDLNCGCPVDKVVDDGSGSGLLKDPCRIGEILSNMVRAVHIPVTIKVRCGWDEGRIIVRDLVRIAELSGAQAITVHGRTRKQAYTGQVHLEWIREAVEAATTIPVIGNGDIFSAKDAYNMFAATGCAGVMVARGMLTKPWLIQEILSDPKPNAYESATARHQLLNTFFSVARSYYPDRKALLEIKRISCSCIGREKNARHYREAINKASSFEQVREVIDRLYQS